MWCPADTTVLLTASTASRGKPALSSPHQVKGARQHQGRGRLLRTSAFGTAVGRAALTSDDGRHSPADGIVEAHGPKVDVAGFSLHAVDVEALDKEPGEGGEEEAVQEDGNHSAKELGRQKPLRDGPSVPTLTASSTPCSHPHGHVCSTQKTSFSVRLMPRRKSSSEKKRVTDMLE